MNRINLQFHQQGAALVVGLILLVVVTVLAVSGMNTATTELAIARNDQNFENAFQAAETGLHEHDQDGAYQDPHDVGDVGSRYGIGFLGQFDGRGILGCEV